ncbi:uncharacterized protein [Dermacentor andersoni]|uniref:uncharacterized protein n=1 Tax=Dermacentor andersoni TaxID=34620 RepID=UPI002417D48F|nr:uncharacterized protein LOC129387502 [Dermacentor andersoni]
MAVMLVPSLLLVLSASAVHGRESSKEHRFQSFPCTYVFQYDTEALQEALATNRHAVAYFTSIDDPSERCLRADLKELDEHRAVYVFHSQSQDGQSGGHTRDYCINVTAIESGGFPLGPCDGSEPPGMAQTLFFDGHSCFCARYPLFGTEQCMLWVEDEYKDSVSDECLQGYDQNCGSKKYKLYDSEQCR